VGCYCWAFFISYAGLCCRYIFSRHQKFQIRLVSTFCLAHSNLDLSPGRKLILSSMLAEPTSTDHATHYAKAPASAFLRVLGPGGIGPVFVGASWPRCPLWRRCAGARSRAVVELPRVSVSRTRRNGYFQASSCWCFQNLACTGHICGSKLIDKHLQYEYGMFSAWMSLSLILVRHVVPF